MVMDGAWIVSTWLRGTDMTSFRVRWRRRGTHIHARVFVATQETHAQAGLLVFTDPEWESFLRCFQDKGTDLRRAREES
jgi:hypothetical protein